MAVAERRVAAGRALMSAQANYLAMAAAWNGGESAENFNDMQERLREETEE